MTSKGDFASFMESSFSETASEAFKRIKRGDVVTGTIIQISSDSIFVDLGIRAEGRIVRAELEDNKGKLQIKVGDPITATVVDPFAVGGPLLATTLSREEIDINSLQFAMESAVPIEGRVSREVNGGLEIELGNTLAFCPASQVEIGYTTDLSPYIGQTLRFRVIEIRDRGRSVVVSRRVLLEKEKEDRAREMLQHLRVGEDREGIVHSIQKYGAFIDLGGVQGLLHISELITGRVERVEDVIQIGETVRVRILDIDQTEKGPHIKLSMKAVGQNQEKPTEPIGANEILKGMVIRHTSFGIFVETPKGEGVVFIQDLNLAPGSDHRRSFPKGKEVEVVLLEQDSTAGRNRFSVSGVIEVAERNNFQEYRAQKDASQMENSSNLGSLGMLLQKKLGLKTPPIHSPSKAASTVLKRKPPPHPLPGDGTEQTPSASAQPLPVSSKNTNGPKPKGGIAENPQPNSRQATTNTDSQPIPSKARKKLPEGVFRRKRLK